MKAPRLLATILLGVGLAFITTTPAIASSKNVQSGPETGRCYGNICLYWFSDGTGAMFEAPSNTINDLGLYTFSSGTGTGAGYKVRNNAASMDCTIGPAVGCYTYVSPNLTGNIDWTPWGTFGTLFYTWNNEASLKIV